MKGKDYNNKVRKWLHVSDSYTSKVSNEDRFPCLCAWTKEERTGL